MSYSPYQRFRVCVIENKVWQFGTKNTKIEPPPPHQKGFHIVMCRRSTKSTSHALRMMPLAQEEVSEELLGRVALIDGFSHFGGPKLTRRGYVAEDGVHPNERGTKLLAALVFSELLPEAKKCLARWKDAPKVVGDENVF